MECNFSGDSAKGYYMTADPLLYGALKQFVHELRNQRPTQAECLLWECLRGGALGVKFRRQHIIGPFIADFFCLKASLIVEIDGEYHQLPQQKISDAERTSWLNSAGYKVIRFSNNEILFEIDKVIRDIKQELHERDE